MTSGGSSRSALEFNRADRYNPWNLVCRRGYGGDHAFPPWLGSRRDAPSSFQGPHPWLGANPGEPNGVPWNRWRRARRSLPPWIGSSSRWREFQRSREPRSSPPRTTKRRPKLLLSRSRAQPWNRPGSTHPGCPPRPGAEPRRATHPDATTSRSPPRPTSPHRAPSWSRRHRFPSRRGSAISAGVVKIPPVGLASHLRTRQAPPPPHRRALHQGFSRLHLPPLHPRSSLPTPSRPRSTPRS